MNGCRFVIVLSIRSREETMKYLKKLILNDKKFYKEIFTLALPIALQSLITVGVNLLDTIMIGRLGEAELSASSLANQFINIYHIFCMGLGMGASVLISRYWGMRSQEPERAMNALWKTICIMLRLTVSLALLFAVATFLFPDVIMKMYTEENTIILSGVVYLKYSVLTYFFLGLSLVCTIVLRSVGQVKIPLFTSIGAFFINLIANYSFIFGHFGMPKMGITGAAFGTLVARVFECTIIFGYLLFFDKKISFRPSNLFMRIGDLFEEYIRISVPVLISDGILAIGNNTVAVVIGRLGRNFVAANAITAVIQQMSGVLLQGVSQAGAIITGQTLGEGRKEKALKQGYGFLGFGLFIGLFSAIFIMSISEPLIQFYQVSEQTVQLARQLMRAISLVVIFQSVNNIMTKGVLRGGGDTKMLMLCDNIFLWTISIPLGLLTGFVFKSTPFWVYICLKFDQIAKAVWCVFRLRSGKWIKKIYMGKKTGR